MFAFALNDKGRLIKVPTTRGIRAESFNMPVFEQLSRLAAAQGLKFLVIGAHAVMRPNFYERVIKACAE